MLRKGRLLALLAIVSLSLTILSLDGVDAQAKIITVPDDYSDIQDAVDHANTGDTVFVKSGNYIVLGYPTGLIIDKSISLIGQNREDTILTQRLYKGSDTVLHVSADDVTISGFTISGGIMRNIDVSGSGCKILDNNIVYGYSNGMQLSGTDNIVSGNKIGRNDVFGIYVTSNDCTISNNSISNNEYAGIIVDSSKNVTIRHNELSSNGNREDQINTGGLILRWDGPFFVEENNISNNYGFGIIFSEGCNNAVITSNNITRNQFGFRLLNYMLSSSGIPSLGSNNQVFWNNIVSNVVASVFVDHAIAFNLSMSEGDIGNGTDIVSWDNDGVGNYWSDHIGSGSYVIDEKNIDHYPLTQQVEINSSAPKRTPSSATGFLIFEPTTLAIFIGVPLLVIVIFLLFYRRYGKKVNVNANK